MEILYKKHNFRIVFQELQNHFLENSFPPKGFMKNIFSSLHNDDAIDPSSGHQMKTKYHNIL